MIITSIRITTPNTGTRMIAVATITIDNMVAIHGIKLINGSDGMFLAMPSKTKGNGQFEDIVHPINTEVRNAIEQLLFKAYEYCNNNNFFTVQFDLGEEKLSQSLFYQEFNDFQVTIIREEGPMISKEAQTHNAVFNRGNNASLSHSKINDDELWKWLNS